MAELGFMITAIAVKSNHAWQGEECCPRGKVGLILQISTKVNDYRQTYFPLNVQNPVP